MIKSIKLTDSKIKTCPQSLMAIEISGNDRDAALKMKEEFDKRNEGKTKRLVEVKPGTWKEIYE